MSTFSVFKFFTPRFWLTKIFAGSFPFPSPSPVDGSEIIPGQSFEIITPGVFVDRLLEGFQYCLSRVNLSPQALVQYLQDSMDSLLTKCLIIPKHIMVGYLSTNREVFSRLLNRLRFHTTQTREQLESFGITKQKLYDLLQSIQLELNINRISRDASVDGNLAFLNEIRELIKSNTDVSPLISGKFVGLPTHNVQKVKEHLMEMCKFTPDAKLNRQWVSELEQLSGILKDFTDEMIQATQVAESFFQIVS